MPFHVHKQLPLHTEELEDGPLELLPDDDEELELLLELDDELLLDDDELLDEELELLELDDDEIELLDELLELELLELDDDVHDTGVNVIVAGYIPAHAGVPSIGLSENVPPDVHDQSALRQ